MLPNAAISARYLDTSEERRRSMTKVPYASASIFVALVPGAFAADVTARSETKHDVTKATYMVTGLHCQGCTRTVESSLRRAKGVHSVKVDWKTKNAQLEFDETEISAQKAAELLAATPHMMGRNMHYGGLLVLHVAQITDEKTAKPAQEALSKVKGVERVLAYPAQHAIGVQFATKGDVTTKQLIEALHKVGVSATT
jgi:copper chaperone CopZ